MHTPKAFFKCVLVIFFQLESLNLGNNKFEDLPQVLAHLSGLQKLHLFNNQLRELNSVVLSKLITHSFNFV